MVVFYQSVNWLVDLFADLLVQAQESNVFKVFGCLREH